MLKCLASVVAAVALLAGMAGPALAVTPTTWHRLNPYAPSGLSEHERLLCRSNGVTISCRYDKLPERTLGFGWDSTKGTFSGVVVSDWVAPDWFPSDAKTADVVYQGGAVYYPAGGAPFGVTEQLIFANDGALFVYWVDNGFVCPWYPSFRQALDEDPLCTPPS
jgi:hypothetical protein